MKEEKEKRYWPSSVRYIPAELTKRDQPLTLRDFLLFIIVPSALRSAPRAHLRPPIRKNVCRVAPAGISKRHRQNVDLISFLQGAKQKTRKKNSDSSSVHNNSTHTVYRRGADVPPGAHLQSTFSFLNGPGISIRRATYRHRHWRTECCIHMQRS